MTFKELCQEPRSSPDYAAIGARFNSIIVRGVPQLTMSRRDWLRRFILLIDTLYYMHINVVIEAEVPLEHLFDMEEENDAGFDPKTRTKGGVDIHMLEDL